jgi:hypothetical protein
MSLLSFAESELRLAGLFDENSDYNGEIGKTVMELMEVFSNQGHSGFSANMTINIFKKLANFTPLTPLTGEDDEWMEIGENLYQNKRAPFMFKDSQGAYNLEGKVFREPNGSCYTSSNSKVYVTFPYTPTTEYVDVEENA